MLRSLPTRLTETADADKEVYIIALDGVYADALGEATIAIIRGRLGHAFYPSPPEFRLLCDQLAEPIQAEVQRRYEANKAVQEQLSLKPPDPLKEGWQERSRARYAAFCQENEKLRQGPVYMTEAMEIDAIRSKYDPALLDAVPDATPLGFDKLNPPRIRRP